jgi:hypothetical protein
MNPAFSLAFRRGVLAASLGLVIFSPGFWVSARAQAISNPNGRTGLRGGASVVTNFNNLGGASVVIRTPGISVAGGGSGINVPAQSNLVRTGAPLTRRATNYFIGGGYVYPDTTYIGGDYAENNYSTSATATSRSNFNYLLLRRLGYAHGQPSSVMAVDGFVSGLPVETWPRGPFLQSYWSEAAMAAAGDHIGYLLGRVSNYAVAAPWRAHTLPLDYLALHPLLYFPQAGRFALTPALSEVLRKKMGNGGILVFDDYVGHPHESAYLEQIRRQFGDFEVTALPLESPFAPAFFAVQLMPRPAVVAGVRQSVMSIFSETAEANNSGHEGISVSTYFGPDGQVIILAN